MRYFFYVFIYIIQIICDPSYGQSNAYGLRAGYGLSYQRWQSSSGRNPLLIPHADLYIGSESESGNVIYGSLGYHLRGSKILYTRFVDINGNVYPGGSFAMKFHQVALELGIKKAKAFENFNMYYGFGLRGEYTAKTQFDIYPEYKDFVRKLNYGFSLSGSVEKNLSKFVVGAIEVRICPDLSRQILVREGTPYYNPFTNNVEPGPEQSVKNLGIEISLCLKFLQILEYVD